MDDHDTEFSARRGTAVLVISIVVVASLVFAVLTGPGAQMTGHVRVAVIDSGIESDVDFASRIVAQRSFISAEFGYSTVDNSTDDSLPGGSAHGTYVAFLIARGSARAEIVNAKVVTSSNEATISAIVAAVRWVVLEEHCQVINLSLGGTPTREDPLSEIVQWAFRRGVVVIAAAGNSGENGVAGSSIESPATVPESIAVAALDTDDHLLGFSSIGPLRNGTCKPDIAAPGYFSGNGATVFGTSFAAPRVSAAAAEIIGYCLDQGWSWTPGMVKAVLMASAQHLSEAPYRVGAGLLDTEMALRYLDHVPRRDGLPLVSYVSPRHGPWDFERWFVNSTSLVQLSVFTSSNDTWIVTLHGSASYWAGAPMMVQVDQVGSLEVRVRVISDRRLPDLRLTVTLSAADYNYMYASFTFDADLPLAVAAFEIAHSPWPHDSMYGQFRELYRLTTELGVAVQEIRDPSEVTYDNLREYDLVFVLDPCAYQTRIIGNQFVLEPFRRYSTPEIYAYEEYWKNGGSLFVIGLGNSSLDLSAVNVLAGRFNFSFAYDRVPAVSIVINGHISTQLVTDIREHPLTQGVTSFDYYGCSINVGQNVTSLATVSMRRMLDNGTVVEENRTVLAAVENANGGRLVATGSNFFVDNWGLLGLYKSNENAKLTRQIVLWLFGIVG